LADATPGQLIHFLNDAPMALPDAWLTAVFDAGGDIEQTGSGSGC